MPDALDLSFQLIIILALCTDIWGLKTVIAGAATYTDRDMRQILID